MNKSETGKPYVLGTGEDELARLGLQHRLWADAAHVAWKKAGIYGGQRVLDVGCGPGYAAFDLAQLVTPRGRVIGIDESPNFIEHLNAQAAARGLTQLRGVVGESVVAGAGSSSRTPALRTMSLQVQEKSQIGDDVSLEYGALMEAVIFLDRLTFFSPYARVSYDNRDLGTFSAGYASGATPAALMNDPRTGMSSAAQDSLAGLGVFDRIGQRFLDNAE